MLKKFVEGFKEGWTEEKCRQENAKQVRIGKKMLSRCILAFLFVWGWFAVGFLWKIFYGGR